MFVLLYLETKAKFERSFQSQNDLKLNYANISCLNVGLVLFFVVTFLPLAKGVKLQKLFVLCSFVRLIFVQNCFLLEQVEVL